MGFQADVSDLTGLASAIAKAKDRFESIDVLEFSIGADPSTLRTPRNITVENLALIYKLLLLLLPRCRL